MKTFDVTTDHILVHFIGTKVGLYVSFLIRLYVVCYKQRCHQVLKFGWADSNVVDIICPFVAIGLTELPNSGCAKAQPAHPLAASLQCTDIKQEGAQIFRYSNKDRLENKEMHFLFLVKRTSAFTILLKTSKDLLS